MGWWIGTEYPPPIGLCDAVWVEADTEPEAAQKVIDVFEGDDGREKRDPAGEVGTLPHVFVVKVDHYSAWHTRLVPAPCPPEFACCGGPVEFTPDGHSGYCPKKEPAHAE